MAKRLFDIIMAGAGLAALAPLLLFVAILIRVNLGAPVLFRQQRPGLHGAPFFLVKFRTMRDACDNDGNQLPDEQRMTKLGTALRNLSLDELPELWNVLKGDMSLVGPRPLLMEYLPLYSPEQTRRHEVKPGITGWAQINGRNAISWEDKFSFDVWYVDHQSNWLDMKILIKTIFQVITGHGVSKEGHVTTDYFRGSPSKGNGHG